MIASSRPWSLAFRLGWRLAAVMVAAILLAAGAMVWRAVEAVHDVDDSALQNQAALIAVPLAAVTDGDGPITLPEALAASFRESDGDNVFMVYDRQGRLIATSDAAAAARLGPQLPRGLPSGFFDLPPMAEHAHGMIGLIVPAGARRVAVLQGREQTAVLMESLMGNFLVGALWLLVPIGMATVLVGVLTLYRGLRPVRGVSAAAARVGPSRPGVRLPDRGLPREVVPLVTAVNDALARLEHGLDAQRRFMAEAAHALRTPLAVLTARLDVLEGHPEADALHRDADRMARLVGQLLRMARLESLPLDVTDGVELHRVAVEAISDLAPLALRHGVRLALLEDTSVAPILGNHPALVLALTNLVENAIRHAPAGSVVEVTISTPAVIAVLDRGPGVRPEDRARIFERFERGPAAREGGAGLGLAIVAEIAEAHGGAVSATTRVDGGAAFVLRLAQGEPQARPAEVRGAAENHPDRLRAAP